MVDVADKTVHVDFFVVYLHHAEEVLPNALARRSVEAIVVQTDLDSGCEGGVEGVNAVRGQEKDAVVVLKRAKEDFMKCVSYKLAHYGPVMDVICQHHPEYTALAWGAFKFLFVVTGRLIPAVCFQPSELRVVC